MLWFLLVAVVLVVPTTSVIIGHRQVMSRNTADPSTNEWESVHLTIRCSNHDPDVVFDYRDELYRITCGSRLKEWEITYTVSLDHLSWRPYHQHLWLASVEGVTDDTIQCTTSPSGYFGDHPPSDTAYLLTDQSPGFYLPIVSCSVVL